MMTKKHKKPSPFVALLVLIAVIGIATGVVVEKGFTLAVVPVVLGGLVIWGVIWIGGFQIGEAFADWLERRWYG